MSLAHQGVLLLDQVGRFWVHVDVDILDPAVMPAVDSPDPGGIDHHELVTLLGTLLASPRCVGLDVTVFDPDLDPVGSLAAELTDTLVASFTRDEGKG